MPRVVKKFLIAGNGGLNLTHSEEIKYLEPSNTHKIYLEGKEYDSSLFDRVDLIPGHYFSGPAIISQDDTTTIVLPEFDVKVDKFKNLIISKRAQINGN